MLFSISSEKYFAEKFLLMKLCNECPCERIFHTVHGLDVLQVAPLLKTATLAKRWKAITRGYTAGSRLILKNSARFCVTWLTINFGLLVSSNFRLIVSDVLQSIVVVFKVLVLHDVFWTAGLAVESGFTGTGGMTCLTANEAVSFSSTGWDKLEIINLSKKNHKGFSTSILSALIFKLDSHLSQGSVSLLEKTILQRCAVLREEKLEPISSNEMGDVNDIYTICF